MKIRVAIADDHPLIITGLTQIFQSCEDLEVLATYPDGRELLNGLRTLQPDVLLLDLHMPHATGEEARVERQCIAAIALADTGFHIPQEGEGLVQCHKPLMLGGQLGVLDIAARQGHEVGHLPALDVDDRQEIAGARLDGAPVSRRDEDAPLRGGAHAISVVRRAATVKAGASSGARPPGSTRAAPPAA